MSKTTKRYPLIANNLAAVRICCGILTNPGSETFPAERVRSMEDREMAKAKETLERIGAALDVMTAMLRETEELGLIMDEELVADALRHSDRILSHGIRAAGQGPGPDLIE